MPLDRCVEFRTYLFQWRMEDPEDEEDEPFPAPPSQDEVNNNALFEEYLNDCYSSEQEQQLGHRSGTPAPPPRDSRYLHSQPASKTCFQ